MLTRYSSSGPPHCQIPRVPDSSDTGAPQPNPDNAEDCQQISQPPPKSILRIPSSQHVESFYQPDNVLHNNYHGFDNQCAEYGHRRVQQRLVTSSRGAEWRHLSERECDSSLSDSVSTYTNKREGRLGLFDRICEGVSEFLGGRHRSLSPCCRRSEYCTHTNLDANVTNSVVTPVGAVGSPRAPPVLLYGMPLQKISSHPPIPPPWALPYFRGPFRGSSAPPTTSLSCATTKRSNSPSRIEVPSPHVSIQPYRQSRNGQFSQEASMQGSRQQGNSLANGHAKLDENTLKSSKAFAPSKHPKRGIRQETHTFHLTPQLKLHSNFDRQPPKQLHQQLLCESATLSRVVIPQSNLDSAVPIQGQANRTVEPTTVKASASASSSINETRFSHKTPTVSSPANVPPNSGSSSQLSDCRFANFPRAYEQKRSSGTVVKKALCIGIGYIGKACELRE